MNFVQVVVLAIVQGLAELLPVSSSAHVIVAEKLMGLDPSTPEATFLLVMLHTGTMFAVVLYFWRQWWAILSGRRQPDGGAGMMSRSVFIKTVVIATGFTGVIGLGLKVLIERVVMAGNPHAEVEQLFSNLPLMAGSLLAAGVLIITSGKLAGRMAGDQPLSDKRAALIGIVQGLCLPFRGFSRSGATISVGMLAGVSRQTAESFSFALAVVLTPAAILLEAHRLVKSLAVTGATASASASLLSFHTFLPGLAGMAFSFLAGLVALKWLSAWLENGRWALFGYYCLVAAVAVVGVSLVA